jgi:prepilin-type N-terminal cleavage/methylation domain-containing protein
MLNRRHYLERLRTFPGKGRGFTLFELIVVIVLVSMLSAMVLDRFLVYQEMAEKTAMEQTAGAIRSALNIQMAGLIARGRTEDIPKLAAVNPIKFLTERQRNYVGEFYEVGPDDIPTGSWYFDLKRKQLVYSVHRGAYFVPDENGHKRVRYAVTLVYNEGFLNGPSGAKELGGVVLREVVPYKWELK